MPVGRDRETERQRDRERERDTARRDGMGNRKSIDMDSTGKTAMAGTGKKGPDSIAL
jgi:hypothetical protein